LHKSGKGDDLRYKDRTIKSTSQLLSALKQQRASTNVSWFRGQAKKSWKLVPSLARNKNHLKAENALIKRFKQDAIPHLSADLREEWEWMFLMQHHRAFTRLLDWSESPLAALYFAVNDDKHIKSDGAVWCLDPVALNKEARIKFEFESEIPAFGHDKALESYLPSRLPGGGSSDLYPIAIVGPRNTPRMAAQLGTFTVNHIEHTPIEEIGDAKHIWKWVIPAGAKSEIAKELGYFAISRLTLFPELDSVADASKELLP